MRYIARTRRQEHRRIGDRASGLGRRISKRLRPSLTNLDCEVVISLQCRIVLLRASSVWRLSWEQRDALLRSLCWLCVGEGEQRSVPHHALLVRTPSPSEFSSSPRPQSHPQCQAALPPASAAKSPRHARAGAGLCHGPPPVHLVDESEPHMFRRKAILAKYGREVTKLMKHEPIAKYYCAAITAILLTMSVVTRQWSWPAYLRAMWCCGTVTHSAFLAVHEVTHHNAFKSQVANALLSIVVNWAISVPYSPVVRPPSLIRAAGQEGALVRSWRTQRPHERRGRQDDRDVSAAGACRLPGSLGNDGDSGCAVQTAVHLT
jgi:hypothetical protein